MPTPTPVSALDVPPAIATYLPPGAGPDAATPAPAPTGGVVLFQPYLAGPGGTGYGDEVGSGRLKPWQKVVAASGLAALAVAIVWLALYHRKPKKHA